MSDSLTSDRLINQVDIPKKIWISLLKLDKLSIHGLFPGEMQYTIVVYVVTGKPFVLYLSALYLHLILVDIECQLAGKTMDDEELTDSC